MAKQFLTGATGLQFVIVPDGKTYTGTTTGIPGLIVFREKTKQIEVNGTLYGADNTTQFNNLDAALTALVNNGLIEAVPGETGVYQVTTDRLGTLLGSSAGMTGADATAAKTVTELIEALQAEIVANATGINTNATAIEGIQGEITGTITPEISGIKAEISGIINGANSTMNTTISNAINALGPVEKTGGAEVSGAAEHVKVVVTTQSGNVTSVTVNEGDIASATGLAAVKATADSAIQSINLNGVQFSKDSGTATGIISGANILVGGNGTHGATAISGAIEDIYTTIGDNQSSATLKLYQGEGTGTEATGVSADGNLYRLVQGTTEIARFNIEKDSFVKSGSVVVCGDGTNNTVEVPNGVDGERYIHLVINTHDAQSGATGEDNIYIPVESLVDSYTTGSTGTDIVQIVVDNTTNKISATFDIAESSGTATAAGATATSGVTSSSTINVLSGVTVAAEDGSIKTVTGVSVLADAAGAAAQAESNAIAAATTGIYTEGAKAATGIYEAKIAAATGIAKADAAQAEAVKHTTVTGPSTGFVSVSEGTGSNGGLEYTITVTGIQEAINTKAAEEATAAVTAANSYSDSIISWEVIS